ncbi:uncharacterized protein LOC126575843 [Anopheles aquasalis]|uniref:uncharacterized protein LOC126575843 n=1 Tax=Anopheles aquasalis TaxID=42839 RepID=UPI00215B1B4B|nr:uncharacterized protein LOC126575843 [Anopheles aquasalis]
MASEPNYTELLPNEVLCMVFDRLDVKNVKNCSLACKRWKDIIFYSDYVKRFDINISVFSNAASKTNPIESLLQKANQLAHTNRSYRNFSFLLVQGMEPLQPIWKIIHPKHTSNMYSLYLNYIFVPIMDMLPMVIDAIPSMALLRTLGVLEEISVRRNISQYKRQENIPQIRSASLKELTMHCKYKYTIDTPELKVFKGALSGLLPPDGGDTEALVLAKLQHLEITVESWQSPDQSIVRRVPNLVKINWDIPVAENLFVAMCNSFPSLIEARFSKELFISRPNVLNHLSKLAQLRRLFFYIIDIEQDVFVDLSELTHLEELDLGFTHVMPISLLSFSKTIKKLGLHLTASNGHSLMEIITRNLMQLTELGLACHSAPLSTSVLKTLPSLQQLEVLVFSHCHLKKSFFHQMNAPMHRLRSLRFRHCELETTQLLGLRDKFPNIKNPEFDECISSIESEGDRDQNDGIQEFLFALASQLQEAFRF